VSVAGTCGSPASSGDFTVVTGRRALAIITVEVTTSTTFTDSADTAPSFADICVASHVKALGTFSSGTLSASSVSVLAPRPRHLNGIVTSVNGVSTADTCGAATTAGSFRLVPANHARLILTVGVTTSTAFTDSADTAPSFADICVGSHLNAVATVSPGALTASSVTVVAPRPRHIQGIVTSVNDVSTAGTCGTSSGPGSFTVVTRAHGQGIVSVEVTSSTTFADSADSAPSFADICVASHLKALGTLLSGTLTASSVSVLVSGHKPHASHHGRHSHSRH